MTTKSCFFLLLMLFFFALRGVSEGRSLPCAGGVLDFSPGPLCSGLKGGKTSQLSGSVLMGALAGGLASVGLAWFKGNGRSRRPSDDQLCDARKRMVDEQIERRGIRDDRVLAAMRKVERHSFLPDSQWESAYSDHPLPIGEEQTISQPYIVALMSESLRLGGDERVLEVGTGCGYQTAVLAELAKEVFSVEILPGLAERARAALETLDYTNIHIVVGDGRQGWLENAPYDAILGAAAPREVPEALLEQLKEDGRLVIPVGEVNQELELYSRKAGEIASERIAPVRFVPLR